MKVPWPADSWAVLYIYISRIIKATWVSLAPGKDTGVVKSQKSRLLGFKSWLCHKWAIWPWTNPCHSRPWFPHLWKAVINRFPGLDQDGDDVPIAQYLACSCNLVNNALLFFFPPCCPPTALPSQPTTSVERSLPRPPCHRPSPYLACLLPLCSCVI